MDEMAVRFRKNFFSHSDPLTVRAVIPVGGYTPGQSINLDLFVSNRSTEDVDDFVVRLIKV